MEVNGRNYFWRKLIACIRNGQVANSLKKTSNVTDALLIYRKISGNF
jgi:hypothetical protein